MAPLITSLFTLNPDVDRQKFNVTNFGEVVYYNESPKEDIKNSYLINTLSVSDHLSTLKRTLMEYTRLNNFDQKISSSVFNNSYKLLDSLSPSASEELDYEDIYVSSNGTIVIDWEKTEDDIFSLEIGSKSLGYFIEVNGVDTKQVDSLSLTHENFEKTSSQVLQDLLLFL